jgi:RNA polymerase sigma-70 factor (ECF subfamily)
MPGNRTDACSIACPDRTGVDHQIRGGGTETLNPERQPSEGYSATTIRTPGADIDARRRGSAKEMQFPNFEAEITFHQRILAGDPIAPADLFAHYVGPLMSVIRHDLRCDAENARDSSIDALFDYLRSPTTYSPERGRLCTFLTQIAKHKALDRIRARSAEARREQEFSSLVEVRGSAPNEKMERSAEAHRLWQRIEQVVKDERDRLALALILDGERSTDALAETLGIEAETPLERQRAVKRHRDRLMKILGRLGEKLRDE